MILKSSKPTVIFIPRWPAANAVRSTQVDHPLTGLDSMAEFLRVNGFGQLDRSTGRGPARLMTPMCA